VSTSIQRGYSRGSLTGELDREKYHVAHLFIAPIGSYSKAYLSILGYGKARNCMVDMGEIIMAYSLLPSLEMSAEKHNSD
jgi:hypothetical protein